MRLLSIDCESSGPCPGRGDLISFGAVVVEPGLERRFRSPDMKPTCNEFDQGAYNVLGISRLQHENYDAALADGIRAFDEWLETIGGHEFRYTMVSDNPAFDWQWINWGFHTVQGNNPLGFSARRIGDFWVGLRRDPRDHTSWKRLRQTVHTHDPLDDALGNAEALLTLFDRVKVTKGYAPCPTCHQFSHSIGEDELANAFRHFESMFSHRGDGVPTQHVFDEETRKTAQVLMAAARANGV